MTLIRLRLGTFLLTVAAASPTGAAEVLRLDFENAANLAEDSSGSGFTGMISSANFGGSITQSTDVPSGSTGTGSALFLQLDFENGMFIEFLGDQFPDFTPDDSFNVSLWVKPSAAFIADGYGFRGIISGTTATGNSDWQIDNGDNVDGGLGDGTLTVARINGPPTTDLIPGGDLPADQWTQISFAFVGPARAGIAFVGNESTPLAFSSAASGGNGFAAEDLIVGANRNKVRLYDGLMDEVQVLDTAIIYDGAGGEFQPGDLDFSGGAPDANDWLAFRGGQGADLSAETPLDAYGRGDMDFDGDNDLADFVAFKTLFNAANGGGALEGLMGVPEPQTALLLLFAAGGWFGCQRHCRKRTRFNHPRPFTVPMDPPLMRPSILIGLTLVACFALGTGRGALAQEALFDFGNGDFSANNATPDGLANFVIAEDQPFGAPLGDLSQVIDGVQMTIRPTVATDADFNLSTWGSNSQGIGIRSNTDAGGGTGRRINGSIGEGLQFFFDTDLSIISIRLGSYAANATMNETVVFTYVSGGTDPFNGGSLSLVKSDTATAPGTDLPIDDLFVTAGTILNFTTSVTETVGGGVLLNGLNVFVGTPPEPLTLQVDTGSGELSLLNNSVDPIEIDYLRIASEDVELDGGSLVPGSYTGLAGAPGFPAGNNDGTGWEAADSNDPLEIIESFLTGSSAIPNDGQPIGLGNAFLPGATQDLSFSYHIAGDGAEATTGLIEYLSGPVLAADFDGDGDVDGDDFLLWQGGFGTPSGALKEDGDADDDGDVDGDDFLVWQSEFGSGEGAASGAVPEPAAIALLVACALTWTVCRRVRMTLA